MPPPWFDLAANSNQERAGVRHAWPPRIQDLAVRPNALRTGRALIHVVLRRRGLTPAYVPPLSVVLATRRGRYIEGLTRYRAGELVAWLDHFAAAAAQAARLAAAYHRAIETLTERWKQRLAAAGAPRADAAAWAVIDLLPAHPIITAPVATAVTGRAKSSIHQAIIQLEVAGVLVPLSGSKRNRAWEASGLLDLVAGFEVGESKPGVRYGDWWCSAREPRVGRVVGSYSAGTIMSSLGRMAGMERVA